MSLLSAQLEDDIQAQIIQYCKIKKILCFAVINDASFSGQIRKILIGSLGKVKGLQKASMIISKIVNRNKKIGLMPGVSDLVLVLPGKTVFIELKTVKGKMSEEQKVFMSRITKLDHSGYICRSLDDFIEVLEHENAKEQSPK